MRNDNIFYTVNFEEQDATEEQIKEGIKPEPITKIEFDKENIKLANITNLEQVGDDVYKMTLIEKGKSKDIDKVHVLGVVSYLDDLQENVETMNSISKLINDMPKERKVIASAINESKKNKDNE
jgi:hypothetical protein